MSEILLSQLAHVELISPKPEETVGWMVDVLGLEETTREGQSVYLRGWAEWLHSSLIVTEGPEPTVGHIAWRSYGPQDPKTVAERLKGSGQEIGWVDSRWVMGAPFAIARRLAATSMRCSGRPSSTRRRRIRPSRDFQNRPQKFSARGASARYLDHVTIATPSIEQDIAFYCTLGQRHTAQISPEPGFNVFSTMTCNAIRSTHDLGLVPDFSGATARGNHIAYRIDQRLDIERAAEVFMANDTPIEFGPGIHGLDEITYLYVREPGGFRIEVNAGGWVNTMPDWQATNWNPSQGGTTFWKNVAMPESMMECWPAVKGIAAHQAAEGFESTQLFVER